MACNTASAVSLPAVRLAYPVPVWGMVDACVEAATRTTRTGRVAVIGTEGTIASGMYPRKLGARGLFRFLKRSSVKQKSWRPGSMSPSRSLLRLRYRSSSRPLSICVDAVSGQASKGSERRWIRFLILNPNLTIGCSNSARAPCGVH